MVKVLGVSCSLRNARYGVGSDVLVQELRALSSATELTEYLKQQTKIRADDFLAAGRTEKLPFDDIYRNLLRARHDRGLSNSEAALAAALWGAQQEGAQIEHCGLAPYFPMSGEPRNLDELREKVLAADALLISGPVYFGDRGSLAQEFIQFLREDKACAAHIRNRVYAGVTVGAKRNGGQETTLIYQIVDMTNLNMLAVGNDDETTSQYGGTAVAGDVGVFTKDDYGFKTAIGTGRRVAHVANMYDRGRENRLRGKLRVSIWMLQDAANHRGRDLVQRFCNDVSEHNDQVEFDIVDFTQHEIHRCIACDLCPVDIGPQNQYRCIIKSDRDAFKKLHAEIIDTDAVLVAAYSPFDRGDTVSVYQRFIERTRYLRRDDYVFGNLLVAPLVFSELGSNQNLHIRMMTSMVRHLTVLHHPILGFELDGSIANWNSVVQNGRSFVENATILSAGRMTATAEAVEARTYNPVGYQISAEKHARDIESGRAAVEKTARGELHKTKQAERVN